MKYGLKLLVWFCILLCLYYVAVIVSVDLTRQITRELHVRVKEGQDDIMTLAKPGVAVSITTQYRYGRTEYRYRDWFNSAFLEDDTKDYTKRRLSDNIFYFGKVSISATLGDRGDWIDERVTLVPMDGEEGVDSKRLLDKAHLQIQTGFR